MSFTKYIQDPTLPLPVSWSQRQASIVREAREAYALAITPTPRANCKTPEATAEILRPLLAPRSVEGVWLLPLDPRSRLIGQPLELSRGDVDGAECGPRLVFRAALQAGATSCIVAHNHPSGDPTPSASDAAVTRTLVAAGRALDLSLVDHIIIGGDSFVSLRRSQSSLWQ